MSEYDWCKNNLKGERKRELRDDEFFPHSDE